MNESSPTAAPTLRAYVESRALSCLLAALAWVVAARAVSVFDALGLASVVTLLGGAFITLMLLALSWGRGRSVFRSDAARSWEHALGLGLGVALLPLAVLGYLLQVGTHHRPLGAATFGGLALLIVTACVIGVRGVFDLGRRHARRVAIVIAIGLSATVASLVATGWVTGVGMFEHPGLRPALPEVVLALIVSGFVILWSPPPWVSRAARWSLPVAMGLCVASLWLLQSDADVRAAVKSAPVIAGVLSLLVR